MSNATLIILIYIQVAVGDAFGTTGDDGREDGTVADMLLLLKQGVTVCLSALQGSIGSDFFTGHDVYRRCRL